MEVISSMGAPKREASGSSSGFYSPLPFFLVFQEGLARGKSGEGEILK